MATMATASDGVVGMTGNDLLDTLIIGDKWNDDHPVTFFFDDGGADADDDWFDEAKDALREALAIYETYIDLTFQEVDDIDDANLVMTMASWAELPGTATATFEYPEEDDPVLTGQFPYEWGLWTPWHLQVGGYAMATVLHEVGHALGLGHPHGSGGLNGQPFPGVDEPGDVGDGHNTGIYTVMSYLQTGQFWAPDDPVTSNLGWGYQGSPMALDVAALHHIYGANPTTGAGNSTYTLPEIETDGTYWRTIWDTGGTDMIRHTGSAPATIDLRAAPLTGPDAGGYLSQVNGVAGGFTIANGVTIEWAEGGSGDDDIYGNGADNELAGRGGDDGIAGHGGDDLIDGGTGNDIMNGGTGDDTMIGGEGNDQFMLDAAGDVMHEKASGGIDTVIAPFTHTLAVNFENLHLSESAQDGVNGYGNSVDNQIIGNGGGNVLEGRGGDDFVNGAAGRDQIDGGTGKDTLHGGNGDDYVDGGADDGGIVLATEKDDRGTPGFTSPTPDRSIDDFRADEEKAPQSSGYDDLIYGGNGQDTLVGRGGDDRLFGEVGDDSMLGGNGADWLDGSVGRDTMAGGFGNDIYVSDISQDKIVESAGGGIDGVFSIVDHALAPEVENLTLTGWAGNHVNGKGNVLANWINGNDGNNVLMGLAGDDLLIGNGGFDWIEGGAGVDLILGGQGDDLLYGDDAPAMVLGPVLVIPGPVYGDTIFGGQGADTLNGRAGDDVLSGDDGGDMILGEAGADTAEGGAGNDTIVGGAGNDSLLGGIEDDSIAGGSGDDALAGSEGNDYIDGGAGADTMVGGLGDDSYVVDAAGDTIAEAPGQGTDAVFSTIGYTLGDEVENLMLLASAMPDVDGTGNALANRVVGNAGANELEGLDGNDLLIAGAGIDALAGGADDDSLYGGLDGDELLGEDGDDFLSGDDGDDDVRGNAGADSMRGGNGNDTLRGGGDDDTLDGGAGDDELIGNGGADRFAFTGAFGNDTIDGFDAGDGDRIAIWGFGAALDEFDELEAWIDDGGSDIVIDLTALGGGIIVIENLNNLQAMDVDLMA